MFAAAVRARRALYERGLLARCRFGVPVLVVGNIAVGGAGKTPLVIWLTRFLAQCGYRPGVVCRGYGGRARHWPQAVGASSDPHEVGDEALVIARRSGRPVVADPVRCRGVERLLAGHGCDVVVSDDGLQHYALARDVEIAVLDGMRRHGNGRCLPAGPLREPPARLAQVDAVVCNGQARPGEVEMRMIPADPRRVRDDGAAVSLAQLRGMEVHAVCGIGNPARFFTLLEELGVRARTHAFPDHHALAPQELDFSDRLPVLMTEKDAVKCRRFAGPRHWYLPVDASLPEAFAQRLRALVSRHGQQAA